MKPNLHQTIIIPSSLFILPSSSLNTFININIIQCVFKQELMTVVIRLQEWFYQLEIRTFLSVELFPRMSQVPSSDFCSEWILTSMTYEHQLLKGHSDINGH